MAWVVSKIIGDGKTPETAFRTALQQNAVAILNADAIPVDLKTGLPTADFGLFEIPDEHVAKVEKDCFVLPKVAGKAEHAQISAKLSQQGCMVNIDAAVTADDIALAVRQKHEAIK